VQRQRQDKSNDKGNGKGKSKGKSKGNGKARGILRLRPAPPQNGGNKSARDSAQNDVVTSMAMAG
jgi:hypothetical protein